MRILVGLRVCEEQPYATLKRKGKTMKSQQSFLWLGVPALWMAMTTWAAPENQMQQHQQMQQMDQEKMHQMSGAYMNKCAEMHGSDD